MSVKLFLYYGAVCLMMALMCDGRPKTKKAEEDDVLEDEVDTGVECVFQGRTFNGGQTIPIPNDVCLRCFCQKGWTKPNDRQCARLDCFFEPPERNCTPHYKPGECCPEYVCPDDVNA